MLNLKCKIIPIVIGATGRVTKGFNKHFEAISGKHSIDELQKTAIRGTSHIMRKVLQCDGWSLRGGDQRWFKRSTRKKRPATRDDEDDDDVDDDDGDDDDDDDDDDDNNNYNKTSTEYATLIKIRQISKNWHSNCECYGDNCLLEQAYKVWCFRGSCCLSNQGRWWL